MTTSEDKTISMLVKEKAMELGFDLCGIARMRILEEHKPVLRRWSSSGMNGEMTYLGQNIEKRINPGLLVPGARSVIVTGLNYYTDKKQGGDGVPIISKYAYGINYHDVIKGKLDAIIKYLKILSPEAESRSFVDSAPVLEKAWAREAGLGWPGKHSVLINNKIGSFFFIGIIVTTAGFDYDDPVTEDYCGRCRMCIDSCPTSAINENRTIDVRRCIAYLTIESNAPVPDDIVPLLEGRVFGCDRCQDVCPWNSKAKPQNIPEFEISGELQNMTPEEWINMSANKFRTLFKKSSIGRRKYEKFMRNVTDVTNVSK